MGTEYSALRCAKSREGLDTSLRKSLTWRGSQSVEDRVGEVGMEASIGSKLRTEKRQVESAREVEADERNMSIGTVSYYCQTVAGMILFQCCSKYDCSNGGEWMWRDWREQVARSKEDG